MAISLTAILPRKRTTARKPEGLDTITRELFDAGITDADVKQAAGALKAGGTFVCSHSVLDFESGNAVICNMVAVVDQMAPGARAKVLKIDPGKTIDQCGWFGPVEYREDRSPRVAEVGEIVGHWLRLIGEHVTPDKTAAISAMIRRQIYAQSIWKLPYVTRTWTAARVFQHGKKGTASK